MIFKKQDENNSRIGKVMLRVRNKNRVNYRKHVAADNSTLLQHLDNFTYVSSWSLPPFNVHHVSQDTIITRNIDKVTSAGRKLRVRDQAWPGEERDIPVH